MTHGPINIRCTKSCFVVSLLYVYTCFEHCFAHLQEVKIVLYSIRYHHTCRWPYRARFYSVCVALTNLQSFVRWSLFRAWTTKKHQHERFLICRICKLHASVAMMRLNYKMISPRCNKNHSTFCRRWTYLVSTSGSVSMMPSSLLIFSLKKSLFLPPSTPSVQCRLHNSQQALDIYGCLLC